MELTRYPWYCGRFLGICDMFRKPDVYNRELVIQQMLEIQDDYHREWAEWREKEKQDHKSARELLK